MNKSPFDITEETFRRNAVSLPSTEMGAIIYIHNCTIEYNNWNIVLSTVRQGACVLIADVTHPLQSRC